MDTRKTEQWSELEAQVLRLEQYRDIKYSRIGRRRPVLFRGVGDARWGLETTLERAYPRERSSDNLLLQQYYEEIHAARPAIETLTGKQFGELPTPDDFKRVFWDQRPCYFDDIVNHEIPSLYGYLTYLRHHGFPSPLLDWTLSPYLAAFFAFDGLGSGAEEVAVYAFIEDWVRLGGDHPFVSVLSPYTRSDQRHVVQHSRYTICLQMKEYGFSLVRHEDTLQQAAGVSGDLIKITIPVTQRVEALKRLDLMNINRLSVYGGEDALVQTIARRVSLF